jgi:tRNA(adenine34) deaminase
MLVICATKKAMKMHGHMDGLLVAAAAAAEAGEVPVAAAISDMDGQIIALAENRMKRDCNALHHAEMLVIQAAIAATGQSRLDKYDLWVTLEPCTMCAGAIAHARIRRLYFAAHDEKAGAVESGVRFFDSPSCHHRPEIYGGIGANEAAAMLRAFFAERR